MENDKQSSGMSEQDYRWFQEYMPNALSNDKKVKEDSSINILDTVSFDDVDIPRYSEGKDHASENAFLNDNSNPFAELQGTTLESEYKPVTVPSSQEELRQKKKKAKLSWKKKRRIALSIVGVLAAILLAVVTWLSLIYAKDAHMNPNPKNIEVVSDIPSNDDTIDWPIIDWEYWQSINPDIIGWVTVPGTSINHAIVQERSGAQGQYLQHDVYGNWSYLGTPYLAAECEEAGLDSRVAPIAGHHMTGTESVFAEFANYNDYDYAAEHNIILLQTPNWNKKLIVQAATIIPGWENSLVTEFQTNEAFSGWWNKQFNESGVKLVNSAQQYGNLYVFYTCSYFVNPANERTVVYAMDPVNVTGKSEKTEVEAEIEAEKIRQAAREAEREQRLEEARQIIEAEKIKEEQEKEASTSSEDVEEAAEDKLPEEETSSNVDHTPEEFKSLHEMGNSNAHLGGTNNEWQEGFYVIGNADAAEVLSKLKVDDRFLIDGISVRLEKIIYALDGDYIEQRKSIGWDKLVVAANGNYYICSTRTNEQYNHLVLDGEKYVYDTKTNELKADGGA